MFMNEHSFEDNMKETSRIKNDMDNLTISKESKESRNIVSSSHPNALDENEIEEIGGGGEFNNGIQSRNRVMEQQREILRRKDQERINGGSLRSGARQFSSPKSSEMDNQSSRFRRNEEDSYDSRDANSAARNNGMRGPIRRDENENYGRGPGNYGRGPAGRGPGGRGSGGRTQYDDYSDDYSSPRRGNYNNGPRPGPGPGPREDFDYDGRRNPPERAPSRGAMEGSSRNGPGPRSGSRTHFDDGDDYDRSDRGYKAMPSGPRRGGTPTDIGNFRGAGRAFDDDNDHIDYRNGGRSIGNGNTSSPGVHGGPRNGSDVPIYRKKDGNEYMDDRDRETDYSGIKNNRGRGDSESKETRAKSPDLSSEEELADLEAAAIDTGRNTGFVGPSRSSNNLNAFRDNINNNINENNTTHNTNGYEEEKKIKLDLTDMKTFLIKPVPKVANSGIIQCYIERNKSGANKIFPEYCLYLKDGDRFLLTAKKRTYNKTSNYLISMQRGDLTRTSNNYIGKLRANFIGTEFVIYDSGLSPKDCDTETLNVNQTKIRQELGICVYASNVLGSRGPRKMKVCVPRVRDDGSRIVWRPLNKDDEMIIKCKEQDHTNLTYLINKPPRWNEQVCAYVLNFNGRVTMASVKNFQLVTPEDQETVVLQFGRVGKDLFTMDFRFPLCPFQAFAITLSSFDSKLACE